MRIDEFGGPEVLLPVEVPEPMADPGQALVRVAAGAYRVPVETVVPLEEARIAHELLERRGNRGKIVLVVANLWATAGTAATTEGHRWSSAIPGRLGH